MHYNIIYNRQRLVFYLNTWQNYHRIWKREPSGKGDGRSVANVFREYFNNMISYYNRVLTFLSYFLSSLDYFLQCRSLKLDTFIKTTFKCILQQHNKLLDSRERKPIIFMWFSYYKRDNVFFVYNRTNRETI